MSPERWQRVQELFARAAALEGAARPALLEKECGDDAELRREVLSLLAHDRGPTLAAAVEQAADAAIGALGQDGQRVGPYRLLSEIGAGGMGRVFLAARDDAEYRQQVAVKLLRPGLVHAELVQRFRTERQILARLSHPNLARLLDGGSTAAGEPYIVMEYVAGRPITEHCQARRLSRPERLRLFRSVCLAVHYAHQNLVVHRDIKPSNVLVTDDGVPRLLDFGIAKLLRSEQDEPTLALTRQGARLLTPEYASPEQIRGEPVTTATDVYSLGALLYELLSGRTPFASGGSGAELERRILEEDPLRPSLAARATARGGRPRAAPRLRDAELDTIVLKALQKAPARRYASAEQLAEDVQRYLAGRPLLARPDSLRYRVSKFVRRHPLGVAAAAAFVALVLVFGAAMGALASRLRDERNRAQTEAETARQVTRFLVDLFRISDPSEARGDAITAREVLDQGAQRVRGELRGQPRVQAALMGTIGDVYQGLGLYGRAKPLLEESLATRRRALGDEHPETLDALASMAALARRRSDFEAALARNRAALAARRRVLGEGHPDVAASLHDLAMTLQAMGRLDQAEAAARDALRIRRAALGERHPEVAGALATLAGTVRARGDMLAAEPLYREALALQRAARGEDHPDTVGAMHSLAGLLNAKGDYEEAERLFREVLERRRRLYPGPHPALYATLNNLASLVHDLGRLDEAEPLYREALAMTVSVFGEDHLDVAIRLNNLASLLEDRGSLAEAEPLYRRAHDIRRQRLGAQHTAVATGLQNLGRLLVMRGRLAEGEPLLREALALRRRLLGAEDPALPGALAALGEALRFKKSLAEAEPLLREALSLRRKKLKPGHPQTAVAAVQLGALLVDARRLGEAEPLLREALGDLERSLRAGHPNRARGEVVLGRCLLDLGERSEAERLLRRGQAVLARWPGPAHPYTAEANRALARLARRDG